jgi:hypothetical protein
MTSSPSKSELLLSSTGIRVFPNGSFSGKYTLGSANIECHSGYHHSPTHGSMHPLHHNTRNTDLHRQNHLNQFVSVALLYSSFRSREQHRNGGDPEDSCPILSSAGNPLAHVDVTDLGGGGAYDAPSTTCTGVSNFG